MKHRDSKRTTNGKRRTLAIKAARSAKSENAFDACRAQGVRS